MSTLLGEFLRTRRDATRPETVGLPAGPRRRAPGLRRSELAALAGISVEYLVRIEQGRDRNPSPSVVNALADALGLDVAEREHLRYLTKIAGGGASSLAQPRREVRATVIELLDQLEPGIAFVTNRLGDLLAYTSGFDLLARPAGYSTPTTRTSPASSSPTSVPATYSRTGTWSPTNGLSTYGRPVGRPVGHSRPSSPRSPATSSPGGWTARAAAARPLRWRPPVGPGSGCTARSWSSRPPMPSSSWCSSPPTTLPPTR